MRGRSWRATAPFTAEPRSDTLDPSAQFWYEGDAHSGPLGYSVDCSLCGGSAVVLSIAGGVEACPLCAAPSRPRAKQAAAPPTGSEAGPPSSNGSATTSATPNASTPTASVPQLRHIFRTFWPFAAKRRRGLVVLVLLGALNPVLDVAAIWLFKIVVDQMLIPHRFSLLPEVAGLYVLLAIVEGLLGGADRLLATWLSQRFLLDVRAHVLSHLQRLSPDFFQRSRLGDLLSRLSGDVATIEGLVVSGTTDAVGYVVRLVVFVTALFLLQWQLALVSTLFAPLFWLVAKRFADRTKAVSRERQRRSGAISAVIEQQLANIALVQAYEGYAHELGRFQTEAEAKYRAEMTSAKLRSIRAPIVDLIELAGALLVIGYGAWLLSRGDLTVGALLAFLTLLTGLFGPARGLGRLGSSAYSALAGAERVVELLNEQPRVADGPDAEDAGRLPGRLEVSEVTFGYPGAGRPAVQDISFSVEPGQVVALVGPSGGGKSTLVKLLLRFYDPDLGSIRVAGRDIRELTLRSLRANVAVLLQEGLVFDGTVRENIAYGRPDATEEEIVAAARAADAHEFICGLSEGYDTRVGERGRRLSGGQCQRVAIARAMVRDAPVLILDEPTSALDAESADRIREPLRRLVSGRATIVISHNLRTVRDAAQILVLDDGRITERGTHPELLAAGGTYARLRWLSDVVEDGGVGRTRSELEGADRQRASQLPAPASVRRTPAAPASTGRTSAARASTRRTPAEPASPRRTAPEPASPRRTAPEPASKRRPRA